MITQRRMISALGYLLGMDERGKLAPDTPEKIIGAPDFVLVFVVADFAPSSETPGGYVGQAVLDRRTRHYRA